MENRLEKLENDIDFLKSKLEENLSNESKKLLSELLELQDKKQVILFELAYIQGAETVSVGIANVIEEIKKGVIN